MVYQRPSVADEGRASYITKLINAKASAVKTTLASGMEPPLEEEFYTEGRARLILFKQELIGKQKTYHNIFCAGLQALQDSLDNLWSKRPSLNRRGANYDQQAINATYEQNLLQPLVDFVASLDDRVTASLSQVDNVINIVLQIQETDLPSLTTNAAIEKLEQKTRRNVEGVWTNIITSNAEQIVRASQSAYIPLYILFRDEKLPREFWRNGDPRINTLVECSV